MRMKGQVTKFFDSRGFGFICSEDRALDDVFIHFKEIEKDRKGHKVLYPGQLVHFNLVFENNKPVAKDLEIHQDYRLPNP